MSGQIAYLDFDLLIERAGEQYKARVVSGPTDQAVITFRLPFSDLELENFLLKAGRPQRRLRRVDSPEIEAAKVFGGRLFDAVFADEMRACLRSSLDEAERQGYGLRLRLRLNTPELIDLPWEYLYNRSLNRFLSLSQATPIVRFVELPERIQPFTVRPPLKVLVMIASPYNYPKLDVKQEWNQLREVLGDLQDRGLVMLELLERATLAELQRCLRQQEYHIFHFIGHGGFDKQSQDGILILEDEQERGHAVSGQYLGALLHNHRSLRLAILNACEGARSSRSDPFSGTAQSLVQQGIPAVIAMQFEITDEAAIIFAHEFYAALADDYPVDAALVEVRAAIFARGNDLEWGTPVLYMRSPNGKIFEIERASGTERIPAAASQVRKKTSEEVAPVETVPNTPIPASTKGKKFPSGKKMGAVLVLAFLFALSIIWKQIGKHETGSPAPRRATVMSPALEVGRKKVAEAREQAEMIQAALYAPDNFIFAQKQENEANKALLKNKYADAESLLVLAEREYLHAKDVAAAVLSERKNAAQLARQRAMTAQIQAVNNYAADGPVFQAAVRSLEKGEQEWENGNMQEAEALFTAAEEMFKRAARETAELKTKNENIEQLMKTAAGIAEQIAIKARQSADDEKARDYATEAYHDAADKESTGRQLLAQENYSTARALFEAAVQGYERCLVEKRVIGSAERLYQNGDYDNGLKTLSEVFSNTPAAVENKMAYALSTTMKNAQNLREQKITEANTAAQGGNLKKALELLHELPQRDSLWLNSIRAGIVQRDHEPPSLAPVPIEKYDRTRPVIIRVTVQDNLDVEQVLLHYKTSATAEYEIKVMKLLGKGVYEGEIPATVHQGRDLRYYITAKDANNNEGTWHSKEKPYELKRSSDVPHISIP